MLGYIQMQRMQSNHQEHGMSKHDWVKGFSGAITVCDTEGVILEMNDAAIEAFRDDGGEQLLGANVLDCHPGRVSVPM